MSCIQDRRFKLCENDVGKILKLRDSHSITEIAEIFNVSYQTIWVILNPQKREKIRKNNAKRNKERYHSDESFRKRQNKAVSTNMIERKKNDPVFRKYINELRRWKKTNFDPE